MPVHSFSAEMHLTCSTGGSHSHSNGLQIVISCKCKKKFFHHSYVIYFHNIETFLQYLGGFLKLYNSRGARNAATDQLVSWVLGQLRLHSQKWLHALTLGLILPDKEKLGLAKSLLFHFQTVPKKPRLQTGF